MSGGTFIGLLQATVCGACNYYSLFGGMIDQDAAGIWSSVDLLVEVPDQLICDLSLHIHLASWAPRH